MEQMNQILLLRKQEQYSREADIRLVPVYGGNDKRFWC